MVPMTANVPDDLIDLLIMEWGQERPRTRPRAMQVVGRIIRLGRRFEEDVARMLRPYGVAYSDFDVLATLRRAGAPFERSPTELQRTVLLTSGAMTACLSRLEQGGLISRAAGRTDRRRVSARLSPAGHDLVEQLIDRRFGLAQAVLAGLSPDERGQLEALLRKFDGPSTGCGAPAISGAPEGRAAALRASAPRKVRAPRNDGAG